jgi:3-dehydroquinate dehydratase-1
VLKLGALELGALPRIAVPFSDRASRDAVQSLRRRGLDVAELRVDRFASVEPAHVLAQLEKFSGLPTLATLRLRAEGGDWTRPESERLALFLSLLARVDGVDVELASGETAREVVAAARASGRLAIASHHDFARTPPAESLADLVARARAVGADVVKIATAVGGPADLRALARLAIDHPEVPMILIGMGAAGSATRLLFAALGSLLTYASASPEEATAPGQLSFDDTFALLRRLFPEYDAAKRREPAARK